jgi:Spy/CpxP family protein refolding chaperone
MTNSTIKYLLLISVALNLTVLVSVGYRSYQRHTSWSSPFGQRMPRDRFLFEELGLQPGQVEAMKKRAIPFRAELDRQRAAIGTKKKGLISLLRRENPDLPTIRSLIAEINAMQEAMQQQVALHILEIKGLLDKPQQQRFLDLIANAMSHGSQTGCPAAE